ncbi:MAG: ABC transporter permease [Caulobacterales bacterium]|nr:ABC transporter permease [Caulobacterales bacterium]
MSGFSAPAQQGERVHRPNSRFQVGPIAALFAVVRELIEFRSHIVTLFASDFRSSYRGTALGRFWNFALPLVPLGIYVLLSVVRVLPAYEGLSRVVYICVGVTSFYLLTGFVSQPIAIVKSRNADAMKTALPLSAAIAASFARLFFDTLVRLAVVVIVVLATRSWPAATAPFAALTLLAGVVWCVGLGLFLAILNLAFPDVERVVTIVLRYAIFLSGVIFPLSSIPALSFLEIANPFSVFIGATRDIAFFGALTYPMAFAAWAIGGVALFLMAIRFFFIMEYRIRGLA